MENFICLLGFVFIIIVFYYFSEQSKKKSNQNTSRGSTTRRTTTTTRSPRPRTTQNRTSPTKTQTSSKYTYKPQGQSTSNKPKISFNQYPPAIKQTSSKPLLDVKDLHDAFTGAPLNQALGLYQCQACKVYYHRESYELLKEVNGSKCVSCQSTFIRAIGVTEKPSTGADYKPGVVTLANYRQKVGSVVTFEGYVFDVKESRRGNDFAVMFEAKSWVAGFKLVFFREAVREVGGRSYLYNLAGKTVKVRGLIIRHERFGYEIIVSEKSMILSVQ